MISHLLMPEVLISSCIFIVVYIVPLGSITRMLLILFSLIPVVRFRSTNLWNFHLFFYKADTTKYTEGI